MKVGSAKKTKNSYALAIRQAYRRMDISNTADENLNALLTSIVAVAAQISILKQGA